MKKLDRGFSLTWLGHNTFRLTTRSGHVVLLDPWVEGNPACPANRKTFERIDVMTISHGHGDHMADAVNLGKKFNPTVVCNYEIHLFLQRKGLNRTSPMNKGGSQTVDGIRFTMTHAVHSSGIEDGGQVIYGGEPCGFVITLEDGARIYHAGDTGVFSDMALIGELYAPEIALLPIGDLFTMSPREAAVAARLLRARHIVPAHYGTFPALTGTPAMLSEELKKLGVDAEVVALEPGATLE
ncbi:MAG TPA: metal-dependent hydrolase [Candidatus Eisenbacteria bacterium]|jgi:L-ascorbate metabolism protein UlaG (beta-lactamase superfamily)